MRSVFLHLLVAASLMTTVSLAQSQMSNTEAIKNVIEKHYLEILYGESSLDELPAGFHPEFQMFVLNNNTIDRRTLNVWMDKLRVNLAKRAPGTTQKYSWKFLFVDVTGFTAVAKIEIRNGTEISATDYLTLYKFDEGWKIMSKAFTW